MFYNIFFFYGAIVFYFLAFCFFARYLAGRRPPRFRYFKEWLSVASLSGAFFLYIRYREASHLPVVSLFEITFFFAWITLILYAVLVKEAMAKSVQVMALVVPGVILAIDVFLDKGMHPLNPLLNSFWLGIHVPVAILSYGSFALSFAISLYCIFAGKRRESSNVLETMNLRLITIGASLLAICIVTGAIWAKQAWGTYWSWDPKETWALITFLIYAGAIALVKSLKLNTRWQAILSVSGFTAMLFTFFGVSLLFASHHAYK